MVGLELMSICFITKFPPLVGGVVTEAYWTSYLLAAAGIRVHIVTNVHPSKSVYCFHVDNEKNILDHIPQSIRKNITIHSITHGIDISYNPFSEPYVSQLAGLAAKVIDEQGCNLIYGNYFEPYGIAASLVSAWTGVPYIIRHAGSDIGRLYQHPNLQSAYQRMMHGASKLLVSEYVESLVCALGIGQEKCIRPFRTMPLADFYHPYGAKLDLNQHFKYLDQLDSSQLVNNEVYQLLGLKHIDQDRPIIGVFGKASREKAHFELIKVLGTLKQHGYDFTLLFLTQGKPEYLRKLLREIMVADIPEETHLLPFVPPWIMPNMIRTCDGVVYLEHDFCVQNRAAILPWEIACSGRHLIVSDDIARTHFGNNPKDLAHMTVVNPLQPRDIAKSISKFLKHIEKKHDSALLYYNKVISGRQGSVESESVAIRHYFSGILSSIFK